MRPQTAILPEGEDFAIFLTFTLVDGCDPAVIRRAAARLPALTAAVAERTGEPGLSSAVGFGAGVWPGLFGAARPAELAPFATVAAGDRAAPATPADLFVHIHSPRHDANFALARTVAATLGKEVRLVEEIHGFKHLGGRDLTGFVDGTENPKGDERPDAALVGAEDPAFAGGSYVSIQRWVHQLCRWETLSLAEQEAAIGRTKDGDEELDDGAKPPSAHIARVVIEEDGEELQVVRHSMPYGTTSEHGLYFVAYGRSPAPFRRMLERMVLPDETGAYDRLMDFSRPVTGASFFVPSLEFLEGLARSS
ncbi:MAG: Dyp-type peroxidase [Solirubrobacterales bacterium]